MYVITFYSFKGGVGRTMSLANVASLLAQSGKKVLVVDFDLEAPGISTFNMFSRKINSKGIVDYIVDYRKTGEAPNVSEYIYSAKKYDGGGEVFVMPAGYEESGYSAKLNSIDWTSLYAKEDGYVFFEDMKAQWVNAFGPDYVLIDSRTGHSDVEGICTRQLPDAVCFLFFPNEQNLEGLRRVVQNAKRENANRATMRNKKPMALHFVVSNVPDLDDEEGIVGSTLKRFRESLGYEKLSGKIHHYDSLSLLNQEVFSECRPKSRLTREYKVLTDAIVRENLSDRDVALAFVEKTAQEIKTPAAGAHYSIPIEKVEDIQAAFPSDLQISLQVALIYETIGRVNDALNLLISREEGASAYFYAIRARLQYRTGQLLEASADLERMLKAPEAEVVSFLEALSFAPKVKPDVFSELVTSFAFNSLSPEQRVFVALQIEDGILELPDKAAMFESMLARWDGVKNSTLSNQLAMVSIGLGRFERAIELLDPGDVAIETLEISHAFNLAMAKLGREGLPDIALLSHVVDLDARATLSEANVNYAFCLAIANSAVGHVEAAKTFIGSCRDQLKVRGRRDFSPWTFTRVSPSEFIDQLIELERQMAANMLHPAFMDAQKRTI